MEDPKSAVVFDISSDEEADCGGGGGGDVDFKWIRKFLDEDEDGKVEGFSGGGESEDSDDLVVVVVDEVCGTRKLTVKRSLSDVDSDDDDDDCVMLDGDPDMPRGVEKEKSGLEDGSGDDSDDLVVVSEKGEVACRDFPHSRHLCAKIPFSSSQHELHCDQCHCYVCDSLAPCVYWGTGLSSADHCHATDKEAFWKSRRISLRRAEVPMPIPVPAVKHFAISMRRPPMVDQSSLLVPNLVQQNQVPRQFAVRPCSTPTNSAVPNVTRHGPRPGYVLPRSKYQTRLISQHLDDTNPHVSVAGRRHNNLNMAPQRGVKRTADAAFSSARSGINPSRISYQARRPTDPPQPPRFQGSHGRMAPVTNAYQIPYLSNVGETAGMLSPQTDPTLSNRFSNTMPQMRSQQHRGTGSGNGILLQNQMAARQHIRPGYTNYMPQASSHCPVDDVSINSGPPNPHIGNSRDSFVSGPQTTYQPDMSYGFLNPTPVPQQLPGLTKQNEGRTSGYSEPTQSQPFRQFEAAAEYLPSPLPNVMSSSIDQFIPYQPPEYNQTMVIPDSQTNFEALRSNAAVSDSRPVSCTAPSTQLSGCNSQPQNAEQTDYYSEYTNFYPQDPSPTDYGMKDLEAWLTVDNITNVLGNSSPLLNAPIPSPELASLDGGGLFID